MFEFGKFVSIIHNHIGKSTIKNSGSGRSFRHFANVPQVQSAAFMLQVLVAETLGIQGVILPLLAYLP